MQRAMLVGVLVSLVLSRAASAQPAAAPCPSAPTYGNDASAGRSVVVNGVSLYYESYGSGAPLLLIHGNGGSINSMRCQIAFFSRSRRVIVADSRSHGRSAMIPGALTYDQIADDLAALLRALQIDVADVLGHSDGGIVALLIAIRHPTQVGKVVSSSANLRPDESAMFPWAVERVRTNSRAAADMIKVGDTSQNWVRRKQQLDLMLNEPHITASDLKKITAPVLVVAADSDIMPTTHTLEIYGGISRAQLFVVPGANHGLLGLELYNAVADRFFSQPFTRPRPVGQPASAP